MVLRLALFSFDGVIMSDDDIRRTLMGELLLAENLRPDDEDYRQVCTGKSDRSCLKGLLYQRGRVMDDAALDARLESKLGDYKAWLAGPDAKPPYAGVAELLDRCQKAGICCGLVTGRQQSYVTAALEKAGLASAFSILVAGDNIDAEASKPAPNSYLKALALFNQAVESNDATGKLADTKPITASECIAIEDSFAGITAAKSAGIAVVGVAHTYPNHMLQRRATWVVDYLREITFDWIAEPFGGTPIVETPEEPSVGDQTVGDKLEDSITPTDQ